MRLINETKIETGRLHDLAEGFETEGLEVRIKRTRRNAETPYSGICRFREGRIRVSINPKNLYPVPVRVGSPFNPGAWKHYLMESPEELACFIFLHELSHYMDHVNNVPVRCKQTRADLFALKRMGRIRT
ncbi:MAG: hypothetical protein JW724_01885 [Candidatus Altiarchaeota archaeon]|nr:hypothetical protein [Candidatus Altiarchaeota archaeon]